MGLGRLGPAQGEDHPRAILDEEVVLESRRLYWERDLCIRCIATLKSVPYKTLYDAVHGRTWKHLPMPRIKKLPRSFNRGAKSASEKLNDKATLHRLHVHPRDLSLHRDARARELRSKRASGKLKPDSPGT